MFAAGGAVIMWVSIARAPASSASKPCGPTASITGKPMADILEHAAHDGGHSGHDEDVADLETWRSGQRIEYEAGSFGNSGHSQSALIDFLSRSAKPVMPLELVDCVLANVNCPLKRGGHRISRYIVVCGSDAAC
jgi:hypothetical protein